MKTKYLVKIDKSKKQNTRTGATTGAKITKSKVVLNEGDE